VVPISGGKKRFAIARIILRICGLSGHVPSVHIHFASTDYRNEVQW